MSLRNTQYHNSIPPKYFYVNLRHWCRRIQVEKWRPLVLKDSLTGRIRKTLEHTPSRSVIRKLFKAEIALAAARDEGVRWLVHLDLDELFFLNARSSLALHFEELDALGICQLTCRAGV